MAALSNVLTIGPPADPILVLTNTPSNGNGDAISEVGGVFAVDVIGDTLSIDQVQATVRYGGPLDVGMTVWEVYLGPGDEVYLDPDGESVYATELASVPDGSRSTNVDLRSLPYGTQVSWSNDGRLIAAFYLRNVERVGRYLYRITATSGVGLLDTVDHVGGVYTGQRFEDVATEIIGGAFPFTVAPALADQLVYGWLPYDTRRNNLHQLLFAFGASLRRDSSGNAIIVFLTSTGPISVDDSRITFGGDVNYETPATRAEITEHAFFQSPLDEEVTLFDNTQGGLPADNTLVIFNDAPVYDLTATGLTIASSGVNHAVVSGTGTLTGKLYTHTTRIVATDASGATGEPHVKHVDEMTLVCLANSLNVSQRVLDYYQSAKTIRASLTLQGERCGDVLDLSDPFYEETTAFLESISVNASSDLWGPCRLIEGYTPGHQGNNVTGREELTGSGTWTAPFTGTLQYVLISGAQGGRRGEDGKRAPTPSTQSYSGAGMYGGGYRGLVVPRANAKAGEGGDPGEAGAGGRILSGAISVTQGQQIAYNCGVGGAGATLPDTDGALGTDTTFGSLSTAAGASSSGGFVDPISGNQYGRTGDAGISGGAGADYYGQTSLTFFNVTYYAGGQGNGAGRTYAPDNAAVLGYHMDGGFGGGPAAGSDGNIGRNASGSFLNGKVTGYDGVGGNGADAQPYPQETVPGQGGRGGNGGGGQGAFGAGHKALSGGNESWRSESCWVETKWSSGQTAGGIEIQFNNTGRGGYGSAGGQGADGIILLYWGGDE